MAIEISGQGYPEGAMKSAERCKPDYEMIIKRLKEEQEEVDTAIACIKALANLEKVRIPGNNSLIEIAGAMLLRETAIDKAIAYNIKQQEEAV